MSYTLFFENDPKRANAPAQEVVLLAQLDFSTLDLNTLSPGRIAFGGQQVRFATPTLENMPPVGKKAFAADVDLRPQQSLLVRLHASLDLLTGLMTWRFTSIDPATGEMPEDPNVGFLPPGAGGDVFFSVEPKAGLPTGTVVSTQARILFDGVPLDTNDWFNTIDNTKPTSKVLPPSGQGSRGFPVRWAGTDTGSGLRDFTIYVSDNGGPFTPWLENTTTVQATFTGQFGHTYAFKSRARDNVLNLEEEHAQPDAVTSIPPLATDVSAQVRVAAGSFRYDGTNGRFYQTLTLQNISRGTIQVPMSLALDSLSSGAKLINQSGVTLLGGPYINLPSSNGLRTGQKATLVLEFTSVRNRPITYNTRVLAGPGLR